MVTLNVPNTITSSTAATYTLSGTCDEPGGSVTVELTSDGTGTGDASLTPSAVSCLFGEWSVSNFGAQNLNNGNIAITVSLLDGAQNRGQVTGTTTKVTGTMGMTIAKAPPINDANVDSYALEGTCFPGEGALTVTVGGVSNTPLCSSGAWSATFDLGSVSDGNSVALAASYTQAGSTVNHPGATVVKDTGIPMVTLDPPSEMNSVNDVRYALSGTCSELNQVVAIELSQGSTRIKGKASCLQGEEAKIWRREFNGESLATGTVNVDISHRDGVGNEVSHTATINRTEGILVTISGDLSEVTADNAREYELRGGCSHNDSPVSVSLADTDGAESVDMTFQTACQGNTWEVSRVNLVNLKTGEVTLSAVHEGVSGGSYDDQQAMHWLYGRRCDHRQGV